jgi:hypothetical protein
MDERFLLVKGVAGMGNRILSVLTASLYARLSGRRLIVDWSDESYSTGGVNAFHRFFLSPLCPADAELPVTDSVAPAIWRGRLQESAWTMSAAQATRDARRALSIDLTRLDHPETVAVMWLYRDRVDLLRSHCRGEWEDLRESSRAVVLRRLAQETLAPHPDIQARLDRFTRDHFDRRTVGVHVRFTDYRTRLWAALRTLDRMLRRDPALQVFLATDSEHVARMFETRFPRVVMAQHPDSPGPGRPLHYGAVRPDPIDHGIEALTDLYLLAECDDLIVDTGSSFADVATLLSRASTGRVVDIRRRGKRSPAFRRTTNWCARKLGFYTWGPGVLGWLSRW